MVPEVPAQAPEVPVQVPGVPVQVPEVPVLEAEWKMLPLRSKTNWNPNLKLIQILVHPIPNSSLEPIQGK